MVISTIELVQVPYCGATLAAQIPSDTTVQVDSSISASATILVLIFWKAQNDADTTSIGEITVSL